MALELQLRDCRDSRMRNSFFRLHLGFSWSPSLSLTAALVVATTCIYTKNRRAPGSANVSSDAGSELINSASSMRYRYAINARTAIIITKHNNKKRRRGRTQQVSGQRVLQRMPQQCVCVCVSVSICICCKNCQLCVLLYLLILILWCYPSASAKFKSSQERAHFPELIIALYFKVLLILQKVCLANILVQRWKQRRMHKK